MAGLFFIYFRQEKIRERFYLGLFWSLQGFQSLVYYLALSKIIHLSFLYTLFPPIIYSLYLIFKNSKKVQGEVTELSLVLFSSLSSILAGYFFQKGFITSFIPVVIVGFFVGRLGFQLVARQKARLDSIIYKIFLSLSIIISLEFISLPFWESSYRTVSMLPLVRLLLLMIFAPISLGFFNLLLREKLIIHYQEIEKRLEKKLLGNLKYSEVGSLVPGILHELSNPLTVLTVRVSQLLRLEESAYHKAKLTVIFEQMFKNCERMKMAIQNVREFIHEEKITKEKIQLRSILDGVLIFWRQRLENHGISFRTYGIDGVEIWANRMEVEQILLGLVQHAFTSIEYLADKWIEINTLSKGEFVFIYFKFSEEMSVENVGLKLASSLADLQDEESEVILSLALAKSLAKNNGGDLECLKDVRHTTLVLTVPMAPQEFQGADLFH